MSTLRRYLTDIARRWCYPGYFRANHDDDEDGEEREREQLLASSRTFHLTGFDRLWIILLGLFLIVGVAASTYLLFGEGRRPVGDGFTLVPRSQWTLAPKCVNVSKLSQPIQRIQLMSTNTTGCWNQTQCLKNIQELERNQVEELKVPDILYNFLVGGDSQIYEGMGWNCSSSYKNNGIELLTVAFLGKYVEQPPTSKQIRGLQAFLENAKTKGILSSCYQVSVQESTTRFMTDVVFELEMRRKKNLC